MSLTWEQVIVDSIAPVDLGHWWCAALSWIVVNDDPDEFEIRADIDRTPGLLVGLVPKAKTIKNRLHIDLRPADRDAEVEHLVGLGASRVGFYWEEGTIPEPDADTIRPTGTTWARPLQLRPSPAQLFLLERRSADTSPARRGPTGVHGLGVFS